jgi:predicted NodU family carbamoyl transferase
LGHDGAIVFVKNKSLAFSIEREKDSRPRNSYISTDLIFKGLQLAGEVPNVLALGGWSAHGEMGEMLVDGYRGIEERFAMSTEVELFGKRVILFHSTHERSHIFCSYGLSSLEQGQPCYALVWEGELGAFYEIDGQLNITLLGEPLTFPGYKYSFAFDLANPKYLFGAWRFDSAGKMMALASYSTRAPASILEKRAINQIFDEAKPRRTDKQPFAWSPYLNCGVTNPVFTEFAGKFSDALFDVYLRFAKRHLTKGYPLLVSGGCGLNCEWNTRWRESGLFHSVFVPPVTNDSGSAIGTAVEAQYKLGGSAKIDWDVYRGLTFSWDTDPGLFEITDADSEALARMLASGKVLAWVQGRFELGPRALGNRSLLAAPFDSEMTVRLNQIKQRESYRPIAPVCIEEDASALFGVSGASPHMLYLYKTKSPNLKAVTHVDGSARVQTVSLHQNEALYKLLCAFKKLTGFGVLCNTSLNYPGRGLINRSSDLFKYVRERNIDGAVVGAKLYVPRP